MRGEKQMLYLVEFTSEDVNKLLSEAVELFKANPALKDATPNLFQLISVMNQLLAQQDYNPETMNKLREQVRNSLQKITPQPEVAPKNPNEGLATTVEDKEGNVTPIKKVKKAKVEQTQNG